MAIIYDKENHSGKDVFASYMLKEASYDGADEYPVITTSHMIPEKVILFSEALETKDYNQWVIFYEHDYKFIRIWNQPNRYLKILKKFNGVVTPDFSLYRRMPTIMQKWNKFRSNALGYWWGINGLNVIPNVRASNIDSCKFCCKGIEKNSTIFVSTVGCLKDKTNKYYFTMTLMEIVKELTPKIILVYGSAPEEIFSKYRDIGIQIINYPASTSEKHKKEDK